mmetsp:Transcript_4452/g.8921  ORF Transcript_4452/g.8921 Transcript_4452/m.8921 type:complete len:126 (+) Transcript_4452:283-660(+)
MECIVEYPIASSTARKMNRRTPHILSTGKIGYWTASKNLTNENDIPTINILPFSYNTKMSCRTERKKNPAKCGTFSFKLPTNPRYNRKDSTIPHKAKNIMPTPDAFPTTTFHLIIKAMSTAYTTE